MDRKKFVNKVLSFALFLILSLSLGIYSGIRNAEDSTFQIIEIPELNDRVHVYRDSFGVPTILARNYNDLFFVQGYELARDRTWQLEFLHAVINGRLSMLLGTDLIETDIYIRSLGLKQHAETLVEHVSDPVRSYLQSYVNGINEYFTNHAFSLPWEFQLLNEEPQEWHISDSLGVYSLLAYLFSFNGVYNELLFGQIINSIGPAFSIELLNFQNQQIVEEILSLNQTIPVPVDKKITDPIANLFGIPTYSQFGNNVILVNGSYTNNGNPIISINPNNVIQVPNLWYQIGLKLNTGYSVQGITIPGIPFVLMGHNDFISWGFTPSNIDEIDLIYLESNKTHYNYNNEWLQYETSEETLTVANSRETVFTLRNTVLGPILNISNHIYTIQWTYYDDSSLNSFFDGIFQINTALSINKAYQALDFIHSPIFNMAIADIYGNIASMQSGILPQRIFGSGLYPLNGSDAEIIWNGNHLRSELVFDINPEEGYVIFADNPINDQSSPIYSGFYDNQYRYIRIAEILENRTLFDANSFLNIEDFAKIQNDVLDLSAKKNIQSLENLFKTYSYSVAQQNLKENMDSLNAWDSIVDKASNEAILYNMFYYQLTINILQDEIPVNIIENSYSFFERGLSVILEENSFQNIVDNNQTVISESIYDIILESMEITVNILIDLFSSDLNSVLWQDGHVLSFNHNIAQAVPIDTGVNLGPFGISGSKNTIKSYQSIITTQFGEPPFRVRYGNTMSLIFEASNSWNMNFVSAAPGMSGHVTSQHYDDSLNQWLDGEYRTWYYNTLDIVLDSELSAEFIRGE